MGLSDLYTYDGSPTTIGYVDIMGSGCWNGWGKEPALPCAYHKYHHGWVTPTILEEPVYVKMPNSLENKDAIYRINTKREGEYFLFENKQSIGFDMALSDNNDGKQHGMFVYHVDSIMVDAHDIFQYSSGGSSSGVNDANTNGHPGVNVVSANNKQISSFNPDNAIPWPGEDNKTSFTDATTPNMKTWSGQSTEKPVTNISEKNKIIYFSFKGAPIGIIGDKITNSAGGFILHCHTAAKEVKIKNLSKDFIGGTVTLYSCKGAVVKNMGISKSAITLNVSQIPGGMYIVSVTNDTNTKSISTKVMPAR
jgi:hypothetical protein